MLSLINILSLLPNSKNWKRIEKPMGAQLENQMKAKVWCYQAKLKPTRDAATLRMLKADKERETCRVTSNMQNFNRCDSSFREKAGWLIDPIYKKLEKQLRK